MNEIGIMQGRLSIPASKVQSFPWHSWQEEFDRARVCKLNSIEWLFDAEDYEQNPIWLEDGRQKIAQLITERGVQVRSVCATYFMAYPFCRVPNENRLQSINVLNLLIPRAAALGISVILLPVLEENELRTANEKQQLLDSLQEPLVLADQYNIKLCLETELPAEEYRKLIMDGGSRSLGIYYDVGNATARGYSVDSDIRMLGPNLWGIHIKDRRRGGPSVPLGQGAAEFQAMFEALIDVEYSGSLIMETPVGLDPLASACSNLNFIERHRAMSLVEKSSH
jgi:L-ribulose-5-phosphate 3-epimerase